MDPATSPNRQKLAVLAAWGAVLGALLGAVWGALTLHALIRTSNGVGVGILVPIGGLLAIAVVTLGPATWARLGALSRRSARVYTTGCRYTRYRPTEEIVAPQAWLQRLMQDTRTILHDMDHVAHRAQWWPSDDPPPIGWSRIRPRPGGTVAHRLADFADVNRITRDVWDWIRTVEALPSERQAVLEERGVDVGRLRATLLSNGDFHGRFQAMVLLLRSFEDGLFRPAADPFRGVGPSKTARGGRGGGFPTRPARGAPAPEPSDGAITEGHPPLLRELDPALRALAARYARTPADRPDLHQEMVLAIWKGLPRFRGESSLQTYAMRIARNTVIDHVRQRRITLAEMDLADLSATPLEMLEGRLDRARVRAAIEGLPPTLRDVLVLHLGGHDYRQIAERTGLSRDNVGVRLTRARQRLRRRLAEPHEA